MVQRLSSEPPSRTSRRLRVLAWATLLVLAAHALLLFGLAPAWIDPDDTPAQPPRLSVRSVAQVPAVAPPSPVPAALPATPRVSPPRPSRPRPAVAMPPPSAPIVVAPAAVEPPSQPAVEPAPVVAAESSEPAPIELPVYATRLPAAGRWRYQLQRGIATGDAELRWSPEADGRYELQLEGRIAGVTVLDWVSRGAIDAHGLAPERHAIRRRGRDQQAANFQRDAGRITFSGPTHELPLPPGVQDRLGWLVRLPAIVDAAPERFGPGARVVLMVVGARGGADVWTFTVVGSERIGDVPALKLLREPRRARDTQVQVWLDPARGHLPLRALMTPTEGGPPLELRREDEVRGSTGP